jgi:hypothetical protein
MIRFRANPESPRRMICTSGHVARRRLTRLDQKLCHANQRLPGSPILEPAQCRRRCQRSFLFGENLKQRILSQGVEVIEVFVTQRDAIDALPDHVEKGVFDEIRIARIGDTSSQARGEFQLPIGLAQKQRAGIGCYIPALEIGAENLAKNT